MKRAPVIIFAVFVVCAGGALVEWSNWQSVAKEIAELESYDHRDGKKEAQVDIAACVFKWKIAGRVSDYEVRAKIVREKLATELDWFGGCEGSPGRERYVFAYNSTMRSHLVGTFGEPTVFAVLGEPPAPPHDDAKG